MVNTKWSWNAFPLHIPASQGGGGEGAAATGGETEGVGAETIAEAERAAEATGAAGVTGTAGAVVEQHNDQKLEQQATHWHGKCNLLCKMKNTRRAEEGAEQAKGLRRADRPTATWCHRDRQTHTEREREGSAGRGRSADSHSGNRTMHVIIEATITAQLADINIIQFLFNSVQQTQ